MYSDITDVDEAVAEVVRLLLGSGKLRPSFHKSGFEGFHNPIYFKIALRETCSDDVPVLLSRNAVTLWHVTRADRVVSVQREGIVHDASPTLTSSLVGAIRYAELYSSQGTPALVLQYAVPSSDLRFVGFDQVGPGFLPRMTLSRDAVLEMDLPDWVVPYVFDIPKSDHAFWVKPGYFSRVVYDTSDSLFQKKLSKMWKVRVALEQRLHGIAPNIRPLNRGPLDLQRDIAALEQRLYGIEK